MKELVLPKMEFGKLMIRIKIKICKEYSEMNILFAFGKYLKQKKNKANNKMTRFDKRMRQN